MRRVWLTALIREVHTGRCGTYGCRLSSWANSLWAWACTSVEPLVAVLMSINKIAHLPSVGKVKRLRGVVSADDVVNRKFHRRPSQ